jgi:hypothetical protein
MPISYHIDRDLGLLVVKAVGAIRDKDVQRYKSALMDDPNLECVRKEICDFREATVAMSPERMGEVARVHEAVFDGVGSTMCAVIVSSDLLYGLVRMYTHCVGGLGHEVLPFRDVPEALEWLGLPAGCEDA